MNGQTKNLCIHAVRHRVGIESLFGEVFFKQIHVHHILVPVVVRYYM